MATSVYIGRDTDNPDFSFDDESITSLNIDTASNIMMDELTVDTVEIEVHYDDADSRLRSLLWGTPVYIWNGTTGIGKFFLKKVTRLGMLSYKLDCISLIGMLDYDTYYGGMFTGEPLHEVIENILTTNGLTSFVGASPVVRRRLTDPDNPNFDPAFVDVGIANEFVFSRLNVTVTIRKSLLSQVDVPSLQNKTRCRDVIVGVACDPSVTDSTALRHRCGLYMDLTRNSVNDPWPDYGEVFVAMGDTEVSLGTINRATTYRILWYGNYFYGSVTVNDQDVITGASIPYFSREIQYFFGGLLVTNNNVDIVPGSLPHDVTYSRYRYSYVGEYLFDGIAYKDKNGQWVSGCGTMAAYSNVPIYNMTVDDSDYITFQSANEYQTELLNSIEYDAGIDNLPVYGWMPVSTKREALHQLMFAQGLILRKSGSGKLLFTAPSTRYYTEIPSDRIYDEGEAEYPGHTNNVTVAEYVYTYDPDDSSSTFFSAEDYVDDRGIILLSSAPAYYPKETIDRLEEEGNEASGIYRIRMYAGNCNAVIMGTSYEPINDDDRIYGAIKGTPYDDGKKSIIRKIGDWPDGKDVSTDVSLVTAYNSEVVADRMESYYGEAFVVNNGIMYTDEANGGYYKFRSPFDESVYGFLKKVFLTISANYKADCEFICNYNPPSIGDGFRNYVLLTGSGTWNVPASVLSDPSPRIRVVLISGGQGGQSGYAGAKGESAPSGSSGGPSTRARGGACGMPGSGGYVYEITIDNPAASYTYSAGTGGAGGATCTSHTKNNAGTRGTHSTVSDGLHTYSSSSGKVLANGYLNFITNESYAMSNFKFKDWGKVHDAAGVSVLGIGYGADGGYFIHQDTLTLTYTGEKSYYYYNSDDVWTQMGSGGTNGFPYPFPSTIINATGGAAGGAGMGSNGGNGGNASNNHAGNGGKGGNATWTPPKATTYNPKYYGYGGHGGGGGGGGGSSGWTNGTPGTGGAGGYGGRGGTGGDGCIIIYY